MGVCGGKEPGTRGKEAFSAAADSNNSGQRESLECIPIRVSATSAAKRPTENFSFVRPEEAEWIAVSRSLFL
jgi:hypothetical protein